MELADYLRIVRRWWWLLVGGLVGGAVIGLAGAAYVASPTYVATVLFAREQYRDILSGPPSRYDATAALIVLAWETPPAAGAPASREWTIETGPAGASIDAETGALIGWTTLTLIAPGRDAAVAAAREIAPLDHTQLRVSKSRYLSAEGATANDVLDATGRLADAFSVLLMEPENLEAALQKADLDFGTTNDVEELRSRLIIDRAIPLIRVTAHSSDPSEAMRIANAVVDAFVESEPGVATRLPGSVAIKTHAALPQATVNPFPDIRSGQLAAQAGEDEEVLISLANLDVILESVLALGGFNFGTSDDVEELRSQISIVKAPPLTEVSVAASSERLAEHIGEVIGTVFAESDPMRAFNTDDTLRLVSETPSVEQLDAASRVAPAASGAVIALLALIVVVLLIDYFDDKIRSPEDFAKLTTVPLLAPIAHAARSDGGLESMQHPPTVAGEQYRAARTILTRGPEQAGKVLLVAGPASGDGRTTVAANLAAVFGAVGRRVVAVDADLRRPALHELFRVGNSAGLSTVLGAAESSTDDIIHETLTERVSLITAGPETSNPSELLDSSRMRDLLDDVRARSDIVIIDSPPALEVADASILASAADAILLVVREGHTRSGDLIATVDELRRYGAPIVGALLNDSGSNRRRTVRPGGSDEAQAVAVESGSRHAAGQAVESGDIASSS